MFRGRRLTDRDTVRRDRSRHLKWCTATLGSVALCFSGCRSYNNYAETICNDTTQIDRIVAQVDSGLPPAAAPEPVIEPVTLKTVQENGEPQYWELTLDEAIAHAMANSTVLRDLGATVLTSPETVTTAYTRGIEQTDPRFGMEAALSQFDAQVNALAAFQNNDRVFNNRFLGGGGNFFRQDRHDYIAELSKVTATGSRFAIRNITDYDANNAPGNVFGSAWQTQLEAEARQPLLQGAGLTYNRIAGPNGVPGVANGILIAKVNNDINSAEFEVALRNYISDVINAYWDLYFAYRDLDSKQEALERARETWQAYQAEQVADRGGGVAEALSREQFFRFQAELEDALTGRVAQRTQARNGATGGAFRAINGVQAAERRLRLLIGLPVNEQRMLRPVEEPGFAPVTFDWESIVGEALHRRSELHRQRLLVKRREMELLAARNYLAPRLDLYGRFRVRGLGHDLAGDEVRQGLQSAYSELASAEYREWETGVEFSMPIGFRQGHAAVRNAELQLSRERALLREQERQVIHDLSAMIAEVDRAWQQTQTNLNRYLAAKDAVDALEANREAGLPVNLEQVLDAQRRLTEAQSRYFQSRAEYAVALKNVHLETGSLLEYSNIAYVSGRDDDVPAAELPAPGFVPVNRSGEPGEAARPLAPESGETSALPARISLDSISAAPASGVLQGATDEEVRPLFERELVPQFAPLPDDESPVRAGPAPAIHTDSVSLPEARPDAEVTSASAASAGGPSPVFPAGLEVASQPVADEPLEREVAADPEIRLSRPMDEDEIAPPPPVGRKLNPGTAWTSNDVDVGTDTLGIPGISRPVAPAPLGTASVDVSGEESPRPPPSEKKAAREKPRRLFDWN